MNEAPPSLLAVVEVDESKRVECRAPGCKHAVFRRVHIVRFEGQVHVLGSSCFRKLFHSQDVSGSDPSFTSRSGRRLTEDEQRLLRENAKELMRAFESEQVRLRAAAIATTPQRIRSPPRRSLSVDPLIGVDRGVIAEAKAAIADRHGCDPNLPGWKGLLIYEVQAILRRNAA